MEWRIKIEIDPDHCIEIVDFSKTSTSIPAEDFDYNWTIKPLKVGRAIVGTQYVNKKNQKVKDDLVYAITVTE